MSLTAVFRPLKPLEIFAILVDAMSLSNCRKWFARFREGDRSLRDRMREERPQILDRKARKTTVDAKPYLT